MKGTPLNRTSSTSTSITSKSTKNFNEKSGSLPPTPEVAPDDPLACDCSSWLKLALNVTKHTARDLKDACVNDSYPFIDAELPLRN